MDIWQVVIGATAYDGGEDITERLETFYAALEYTEPDVGGSSTAYFATLEIPATSYLEAVEHGVECFKRARREAGLPEWDISEVSARHWDVVIREEMPDAMSVRFT